MIKKRSYNYKRGFTLVELMVSTSLFSVISIVLISILLLLSNLNVRLQNDLTALNALSLSIENMEREIKMGSNFRCDNGTANNAAITEVLGANFKLISGDCVFDASIADVNNGGNVRLVFKNQGGQFISYRLQNNRIIRTVHDFTNNINTDTNITDDEIRIDALRFYVNGTSQIDGRQTAITTIVRGTNIKSDTRGNVSNKQFKYEYTVTPRTIDG